jgi:hypothetical protein
MVWMNCSTLFKLTWEMGRVAYFSQRERERERHPRHGINVFSSTTKSNNKTKKKWHNNASTLNPKSNFCAALQIYI